MRKLVVLIVLIVFGITANTALAKNQPDAKYFYGTGDARKSDVSFVVSDGKVRKTLMGTGKVNCSPRGRTSIFKSFGGARIKGHAFKRKLVDSSIGIKFVFVGKVYGADANGRMRGRVIDGDGNRCDSGTVRWKAHRVSYKEWKKHRHGYKVSPPNKASPE